MINFLFQNSPSSLTHSSAQSEDGVGHVGHVLLLEEVVGLEDVDLLHSVLHQSFLEAGRFGRDNWPLDI